MLILVQKQPKGKFKTDMNRLKHPLEYPDIRNIKTDDKFITPLLRKIAEVTLPDVWHKYENDGTEKTSLILPTASEKTNSSAPHGRTV